MIRPQAPTWIARPSASLVKALRLSRSRYRANAGRSFIHLKKDTQQVRNFASLTLVSVVVLTLVSTSGCQSWSPASQIKQCQMESDRLLAEFRAQKKRADELDSKYQESQSRLAEAEKHLARLQNGSGRNNGVLADRSSTSNRPNTSALEASRGFNSTTPLGASNAQQRDETNSDSDIQWRPQGAPLR